MASYQSFPNEIILKISENLDARDFCTLLRTNKHTASVLMPFLPGLACQPQYAKSALMAYSRSENRKMTRLLLDHGEVDSITRYGWGWRFEHSKGYHRIRGGPPPPVLRRIPPTIDDWHNNKNLMHLQVPAEFL